ncbi:MAG: peptidylprolyl isomerase [Planctomycetota bacterium]
MEKNLVNSLLKTHLQGKITITDLEIDKMIKSDPKLDRARAKAMLTRAKSGQLLGQYYNELYKKFHVQKLSENFFKAAQIHQRLLFQPKEPRKVGFIRIRQIKNELTPEEKNIVLATYDNGKITLKDWLDTLCEMSPPSRPKDLNTTKGVEQLLERALKMPIFISEAKLLGLDKDENLLKQVKEYEDGILLNKARNEKIKDIKGPIPDEQIVDYFNNNKEVFGTQNTLKIDQIWCQDLKTAQKAKAELDNGKDFESVRKTYSLQEKSSPFDTYSDNEGLFFKDLWNSDPNKVVGPVKGFYRDGFKWRIVKILEKKPGTVTEYSVEMKQNIEMKMLDEQRNTILEEYRKELLKKYSYEIYDERIRDIDPLDIP